MNSSKDRDPLPVNRSWQNLNSRYREDYQHNAIEGLTVVAGLYVAIGILGMIVWGLTKIGSVLK